MDRFKESVTMVVDHDPFLERALKAERTDRIWNVVMPIGFGALVATAWQLYVLVAGKSSHLLIPSFTQFVSAVFTVLFQGAFWSAVATSEEALVIGFVAACVLGVALGLFMGRSRFFSSLASPYLDIAVVTPLALIMPIILMAFGITLTARSMIIFVFALPFVVAPCRAGVQAIPPHLIEMCRSMGGNRRAVWRTVLLPGSMPAVMIGFVQGLGHALTGMILAELTFLAVGIGKLLQLYQQTFNSADIFALVFLIVAQSVAMMRLLRVVEGRMVRSMGGGMASPRRMK